MSVSVTALELERVYPYRSVEHAFRAYLRAVESASAPGFDPFAMRGRAWKRICPKCKRPGRWKLQDDVWRCQRPRCGTERPWRYMAIPKGVFQMNPRADSGAAHLERVAELGLVFVDLSAWEYRVLGCYAMHGSVTGGLIECRDRWPDRIGGWSRAQYEALLDSAMWKSGRKLVRKGLIDPRDVKGGEVERELYTPAEIAEKLGVSYRHVLRLIESGELGHVQLGAGSRPIYGVSEDQLRSFIDARTPDP